jgi:hypothetical protein
MALFTSNTSTRSPNSNTIMGVARRHRMRNGAARDLELALDVETHKVFQIRDRFGKLNVPQSENQDITFWSLPEAQALLRSGTVQGVRLTGRQQAG